MVTSPPNISRYLSYFSLLHEANLNGECSVGRKNWTKTKNSQPQKDGGFYVHSARFVILHAQTI